MYYWGCTLHGIVVSALNANEQIFLVLIQLENEENKEFRSRWKITQAKKLVHISMVGRGPMWWLHLNQNTLLCIH